jgi:pimeloyl-ACP methyl ester carboxylesterase
MLSVVFQDLPWSCAARIESGALQNRSIKPARNSNTLPFAGERRQCNVSAAALRQPEKHLRMSVHMATASKVNGKAGISIILVHGGFVDGAGWEAVYYTLRQNGYEVTVTQNPTTSLSDDLAVTKRAIAAATGDVILVGHSYGGVVITEAGTDPKVVGLVYITAFAPDAGESVATLIANPPPGAAVPPILPPQDGLLLLDRSKFADSFAADIRADLAEFMADSQVPWGVAALEATVSIPAWRVKPSWYLVATYDKMIPPPAQRAMANRAGAVTVEAPGSHAIYMSKPGAVAALIQQAAADVHRLT